MSKVHLNPENNLHHHKISRLSGWPIFSSVILYDLLSTFTGWSAWPGQKYVTLSHRRNHLQRFSSHKSGFLTSILSHLCHICLFSISELCELFFVGDDLNLWTHKLSPDDVTLGSHLY